MDIRLHIEGDQAGRVVTELDKFIVQEFAYHPIHEEQPVKLLTDEESEEWTLMINPVLAMPMALFMPAAEDPDHELIEKTQRLIDTAGYHWRRSGVRIWLEWPDQPIPEPLDEIKVEDFLVSVAA